MDKIELGMFVCSKCGRIRAFPIDQTLGTGCRDCLVGRMQFVTITAMHEGAVRVKLEVPA